MRRRPPHLSIRQAAAAARISETRWRQIESGVRHFRGQAFPERGPDPTVARMAAVVAVTPGQLTAAGRPGAAAELEALLLVGGNHLTRRQQERLVRETRGDDAGNGG